MHALHLGRTSILLTVGNGSTGFILCLRCSACHCWQSMQHLPWVLCPVHAVRRFSGAWLDGAATLEGTRPVPRVEVAVRSDTGSSCPHGTYLQSPHVTQWYRHCQTEAFLGTA